MKKLILLFLLLAVPCQAVVVTIEADNFVAGTNISNAFENITLTVYWHSSQEKAEIVDALESTHSTGLLGENSIGFYGEEWWWNTPRLRVDFNGLAKSIYVTALGREGWVQQTFVVKAFSESDEQIGYLFKKTSSVQTRWILMEFPDYQMAYATIYAGMPVAFDHIIVDFIPEPASVFLLALGFCFSIRVRK